MALEAATGLLVHLFSENQRLKAEVDARDIQLERSGQRIKSYISSLQYIEDNWPQAYTALVERSIRREVRR
jgi:hypothetical protein